MLGGVAVSNSWGMEAVANALTAGLRASGSLPSRAGDIKPPAVIITLSISLNGFNSASFSVSVLPPTVRPVGETFPLKLLSEPDSTFTPAAPSLKFPIPASSSSYNFVKHFVTTLKNNWTIG